MDKTNGKLTVYFEKPFWVGIFERTEDGKLSVAKITFGVEPKDYEVQEYIQKHYFRLKFSPAVETVVKDLRRNPKRMHREAKKQMLEQMMMDNTELTNDLGTILVGKEAVDAGLIDAVGGISEALKKLKSMIEGGA